MEKVIGCLTTNYVNFSGRASRSEYWLFYLFTIIAGIVMVIIDAAVGTYDAKTGYGLLNTVFSLAVLVPGLAVSVRRLHDLNKSGWWLLISIIPFIGAICLIVWFCFKGTEGQNRFGYNPLQV